MDYYVHRDGQQYGPYTLEQLSHLVAASNFSPEDLCWHEGLEEWQPISSVTSPEPPAEMRKADDLKTKKESLAGWSLAMGILSWLCAYSIITSIPAIICGHISLRRIKKNPQLRGKRLAIAALIIAYTHIIIFVIIFHSMVSGIREISPKDEKERRFVSNAEQIHFVMQRAALDAVAARNKTTSWPADAQRSSVTDVRRMLVEHGYLSEQAAKELGFENFLIGNVSREDPPDTILIKSKPIPGTSAIVIRKDGSYSWSSSGSNEDGKVPPRDPPFLE